MDHAGLSPSRGEARRGERSPRAARDGKEAGRDWVHLGRDGRSWAAARRAAQSALYAAPEVVAAVASEEVREAVLAPSPSGCPQVAQVEPHWLAAEQVGQTVML